MDFKDYYVDELLIMREKARKEKNWSLSDKIRDYLDDQLIFVFDESWGQRVYYLTKQYFSKKDKNITNRKYLEYRIKQQISSNKQFKSWLYSQLNEHIDIDFDEVDYKLILKRY